MLFGRDLPILVTDGKRHVTIDNNSFTYSPTLQELALLNQIEELLTLFKKRDLNYRLRGIQICKQV